MDKEATHKLDKTSPASSREATPSLDLPLLGLNALSRAAEREYFGDGHRGAGILAAQWLLDENDMDDRARARIEELVRINWADTELCASFPDSAPTPERIGEVGEALAEGAETLRQVGHNVIFAMIAIKGLRERPELATPERIDGICRLVRSFTPWRDVDPDPDVDPPPFASTRAASRYVLREALDAIERFIGYGQGFAGHMLTFGQALVELAAMGDAELAETCRTAFRKYVTVTRMGPDAESRAIPEHKPKDTRPTDTEYWLQRKEDSLGIGHAFKYAYSCYNLLQRAKDPELDRLWDERGFRIF